MVDYMESTIWFYMVDANSHIADRSIVNKVAFRSKGSGFKSHKFALH